MKRITELLTVSVSRVKHFTGSAQCVDDTHVYIFRNSPSIVRLFFFIVAINVLTLTASAQSWEAHLNVRGINDLIQGKSGNFLIKRKIGERTYGRLGLEGYLSTDKQTGTLGNNILIKNFVASFRPGIEVRSSINNNLFFLRGTDLIYEYSGTNNNPPSANQYSLKQRVHSVGLSPFLGLHYTINEHFGILAETHLDATHQYLRSTVINEIGVTNPNRTEERNTWLIEFQPFQYLTICFTF